ncbi:MAG: type V CRISPR-associated endonuclease Cas1 [Candidatus Kaiserbacteria bacterium]|nr:type V CRISPR-associated endonuclease Cas1 [Candidatus Kaiserbacteria bacterium]
MLTIPDLKEKQILFINTSDSGGDKKIRFENDHIVYEVDGKVENRASSQKTLAVFIIGNISITTGFLQKSLRNAVSIFFMTTNLRVYGVLGASAEANYLLREKQYDTGLPKELEIAKGIVLNKYKNQATLLKERGEKHLSVFRDVDVSISNAKDFNILLGIEGNFSKNFFKAYFDGINWWRREPRTKQDIPNLLLDIGYTLLFNLVDTFLRLHGFDTYKGVYHKLFFARKSLVCDMVEPMRCIIDKQLLKSYNLKQVDRKDFTCSKGMYSLKINKNKKYLKIFTAALMERREDMYKYVQGYYRHTMDSKKYKQPEFIIN